MKEHLLTIGITAAGVALGTFVGMIAFETFDHFVLKPHVKGEVALPAAK